LSDCEIAPREAGGPGAPDAGAAATVELRSASKVFAQRQGAVTAVQALTMTVRPREFVTLVGPSGCGKSTILMMTAGLTPPTAGDVLVGGRRVNGPHGAAGVVFQDPTLLPWRSVLANVMLQVEIRGLDRERYRRRGLELLARAGLRGFEHAFPHELSGGMRQRASLVRALIHEPRLLLMDEPFGALDAITRDQMNVDMQTVWLEARPTVLFVTHSVPEAIFLSDRVLVLAPRPARIDREIIVDLPRPRRLSDRESPEFARFVGEVQDVFVERGVLRPAGDPESDRARSAG
jgi:NitT/TauT family transport system ATP-binding protein